MTTKDKAREMGSEWKLSTADFNSKAAVLNCVSETKSDISLVKGLGFRV